MVCVVCEGAEELVVVGGRADDGRGLVEHAGPHGVLGAGIGGAADGEER